MINGNCWTSFLQICQEMNSSETTLNIQKLTALADGMVKAEVLYFCFTTYQNESFPINTEREGKFKLPAKS